MSRDAVNEPWALRRSSLISQFEFQNSEFQEIQRLETVLIELKRQRQDFKRHRDETHTLLSPARRLPVEVLEQNNADALTLNLSQVCSVWREIVQSRPALWSAMWIDLSHRNRARSVIEHYIDLSKDVPWTLLLTASDLDLRGTLGYDSDSSEFQSVASSDALLYEIRPDIGRMSSCSSLGRSPREIFELDEFAFAQFDKLKSLELEWDAGLSWYGYPHQLPTSFMFDENEVPNIQHLSLPDFEPWFIFPFDRLTSFGPLERWRNSSILGLLPLCRNVKSFTITPHRNGESETLEVSPPVKVFLSSLFIENGETAKLVGLLNSMVAPHLQHLVIEGTFEGLVWEESLTAFLARSQCQLQKLTLKGRCLVESEQYLVQLLARTPTLVDLTLHYLPLDDAFFEALALPFATKLLPTASQILTMAESRASLNGNVASLQSFRLSVELWDCTNTDWIMDSDSILRTQHLKGDGMKISVNYTQIRI
ncbi:hypothetical protein BT96DRAFT_984192 [Gymnopus androsaceus JB14]|uniref:F-box domain-containing protein n=1 Tax=Gymnopus androsaceus JB14 TaxID=1447944 RepID=A0A6A4IGU9_9AGAR|nr:hypothetical protein BT96DRAFT_984192 [Gymnopus androsaceus JB14]